MQMANSRNLYVILLIFTGSILNRLPGLYTLPVPSVTSTSKHDENSFKIFENLEDLEDFGIVENTSLKIIDVDISSKTSSMRPTSITTSTVSTKISTSTKKSTSKASTKSTTSLKTTKTATSKASTKTPTSPMTTKITSRKTSTKSIVSPTSTKITTSTKKSTSTTTTTSTTSTTSTSTKRAPTKQIKFKHRDKVHFRSGNQTQSVQEITLSIPNLTRNKYGNWVYNPWAATFGDVLMDTRFAASKAHFPVQSNPMKAYYPETASLSTACMGSTIPYGDVKVMRWVSRTASKKKLVKRPFYKDLRRSMYTKGDSEECHTAKYSKWQDYQECALRRNQRMEFQIPQYPLIQSLN